uniref:Rho-GAP domain-containing protein n=1 Tax=Sander lucioperca TaxID=283035 RepID=A0A8C9ZE82_SANLU
TGFSDNESIGGSLESLSSPGKHKPAFVSVLECEHRKGTVFGVELSLLCGDRPEEVPFVVLLCTSEIESRALSIQGVYRVSGSKPRIQKICQAFEIFLCPGRGRLHRLGTRSLL